jgi:hypothetical protein
MSNKTGYLMAFSLLWFLASSSPVLADWGDWTPGGEVICSANEWQDSPGVVLDDSGGAYIAWADTREGYQYDLYVQRVDASGNVLWTLDGVRVETHAVDHPSYAKIQLVSDGQGGVIIVFRSWSGTLLAQRVDANRNLLWSGTFFWNALDIFQEGPEVLWACLDFDAISDGAGGVIVTWSWYWQEAFLEPVYYRVSAQRVDANGNLQWGETFPPRWGVVLAWNNGTGSFPEVTLDGAGGAIVSWHTDPSGAVPQPMCSGGGLP